MGLPRGMRDIGADEAAGIESVRAAFAGTCALFGYTLVEPSTIELLSTLEAKAGPSIREDVYHFEDKGGRAVALRFDMTVGMARGAAGQRSLPVPARMAAFGGVWRYDEPQRGRYRHFHQWNVEVYGARGAEADAEVAEFTVRMLEALGMRGASIEVSHRAIAEAHVRGLAGGPEHAAELLRAVDRAQRRPEKAIVSECERRGIPREAVEGALLLARARGGVGEARDALGGGGGGAGWGELGAVMDSLARRGVECASVNLGIVRGLDYYSGTVFEAFGPDRSIGALAGGGRYDSLSEALGGQAMPAAGAAGGVERTLAALGAREAPARAHVAVVHVGDALGAEAGALASRIRQRGVAAVASLVQRPLARQIAAAERDGARAVVIVAPREWGEGKVVVRDMAARTESTVEAASVHAALGAALSSGTRE